MAAIVAWVLGGVASGAVGEVVEAAVDGRPISGWNVLASAAIGGLAGGAFAGLGRFLSSTAIGRQMVSRVVNSAPGQAILRSLYRLATSPKPAAVAVRTAGSVIRQGIQKLEKLGEAAGNKLGGRFAANAARQAETRAGVEAATADATSRAAERESAKGVQATLQGEIDGQAVSDSTRGGVDKSGAGARAIDTLEGRVRAPTPDEVAQTGLEPRKAPLAGGNLVPRAHDAEFKLFGHRLKLTGGNATGTAYLGVTAPMCNSCTGALWKTRASLPGVDIITDTPLPISGAAGALDTLLPAPDRNTAPAPPPAVDFTVHF